MLGTAPESSYATRRTRHDSMIAPDSSYATRRTRHDSMIAPDSNYPTRRTRHDSMTAPDSSYATRRSSHDSMTAHDSSYANRRTRHDSSYATLPTRHASSSSRAPLGGITDDDDEDDEHARHVKSVVRQMGTVRRLRTIPQEILNCDEKIRALFEIWKRENDVSYPSSFENERRFDGFKECVARVHHKNSRPGCVFALNKFADRLASDPWTGARMTLEEAEKHRRKREEAERYRRARNITIKDYC